MSMLKKVLSAAIGIMLCTVSLLAQAEPAPKLAEDVLEKDVLRQILVELKSIRQTLDRTLATQSQLLLSSEQVKMAYQTMTAKSDRLEAIRGEAALVHSSLLEATRTAEGLEPQINQTFDPEQKANFERQLKEQKSLIGQHQQRETELRGDEARLLREFQDSQYRMDQASANLSAIANQVQQDLRKTSR